MAREKGMGNLQREKGGRWTLRVCVNGKRFCRSTGTRDREVAERFARRFLAPLGLGVKRLPLADVWFEYERSPNRRDLAPSTLLSKRQVWMQFAKWMEKGHLEVSELGQLTGDMVGEYLRCLRVDHSATTYNNHVCVLREVCRTLYDKAGMLDDPWDGVRLLSDDSHTRREFTVEELRRILDATRKLKLPTQEDASEATNAWTLLFHIGIYTGLRLGDCCTLAWANVNMDRKVIQVVPRKTRKHLHGRPVTIPIHPELERILQSARRTDGRSGYVLPQLADWYLHARWRVSEGLERIFRAANIVTSVKIEGRRYKAPEATFHSLRHTFVSFAANAGVPLPVVQSIVGHTSTAMTRHYYHETEAELWRAVEAIPVIGTQPGERPEVLPAGKGPESTVGDRLKVLDNLLNSQTISQREYRQTRARILAEL